MDIRMFLDGIYVTDKNAELPKNAKTSTVVVSWSWYLILHVKMIKLNLPILNNLKVFYFL